MGSSYQKGNDTVEGRLFSALIRAKVVYSNFIRTRHRLYHYSACSRTDRGVSALCSTSTLECILTNNMEEKINSHLPKEIRVIKVQQVCNIQIFVTYLQIFVKIRLKTRVY